MDTAVEEETADQVEMRTVGGSPGVLEIAVAGVGDTGSDIVGRSGKDMTGVVFVGNTIGRKRWDVARGSLGV